MGNSNVDRLPVGQLSARYNLVRSAIYNRMDALGIKPERVGNKSNVNADQLRLLDDLHQFIQAGGNTAEFIEMRGLRKPEKPPEMSSGLSAVPPDIFKLVSIIAAEIASRLQPPMPDPDPLAYFETLERAARNGWLLRTSEVAYLLDMPPSALRDYGDRFSEAGFVFTKAGYRAPGEIAWRVSKP